MVLLNLIRPIARIFTGLSMYIYEWDQKVSVHACPYCHSPYRRVYTTREGGHPDSSDDLLPSTYPTNPWFLPNR